MRFSSERKSSRRYGPSGRTEAESRKPTAIESRGEGLKQGEPTLRAALPLGKGAIYEPLDLWPGFGPPAAARSFSHYGSVISPDTASCKNSTNSRHNLPCGRSPNGRLTSMHFPVPPLQPKPVAEPSAMIRAAAREDVQWNRPVFKAPPLELHPQAFDVTRFAQELRRVGLGQH